MPTASEARQALTLITGDAVRQVTSLIERLSGRSAPQQRDALLELVLPLVGYYTNGTGALAADFYDDERERIGARRRFSAEPVPWERDEKLARAIVWSVAALEEGGTVTERLAPVIQLETARSYRDTITENTHRDPSAVGWRRVTRGGSCKLCTMLASRGAVYRESTARFATHENCDCGAQPVFDGQPGQEADAMQYVASRRRTSQRDRDRLRDYLNEHFPDAPG